MSKTEETLLYKHDLVSIPLITPGIQCELEILESTELTRLSAARSLPKRKIEQFHRRYDRGDLCFIASHNGHVVGYAWVQTASVHPIQSAGRSRHVRSGEAWLLDGLIVEAVRRNNIYTFILTSILRYLQEENYRCAWGYTTRSNIASQKGIEKAGFILKQRLFCIEFAGRVLPLPPLPA